MADNTSSNQRVEAVKQRLQDDLVYAQGNPAEPEDVARVVEAKADSFADAPVQEFVPLLIEHEARDELRQHGLHRDLGEGGPRHERRRRSEVVAVSRSGLSLDVQRWR